MNNTLKILSKKLIMGALATGIAFTSGVGVTQAETSQVSTVQQTEQVAQTTKYPRKVMQTVRMSFGISKHSPALDSQINEMPKVEVMDRYLVSFGKKVKGKEVREAVEDVFNVDLNRISENNYGNKLTSYHEDVMSSVRESLRIPSDSTKLDKKIMNMPKAEVMDRYISVHNDWLTGAEDRILINQIFGVNLDGISGAERARMSIQSKGEWILQNDNDLFVISSSLDDVSLYVSATDYFIANTGSNEFPTSLKEKLIGFGFTYDEAFERYSYTNPTGESAPESFKSPTINAILTTIATEYAGI